MKILPCVCGSINNVEICSKIKIYENIEIKNKT